MYNPTGFEYGLKKLCSFSIAYKFYSFEPKRKRRLILKFRLQVYHAGSSWQLARLIPSSPEICFQSGDVLQYIDMYDVCVVRPVFVQPHFVQRVFV